jgi:hypothetical protein
MNLEEFAKWTKERQQEIKRANDDTLKLATFALPGNERKYVCLGEFFAGITEYSSWTFRDVYVDDGQRFETKFATTLYHQGYDSTTNGAVLITQSAFEFTKLTDDSAHEQFCKALSEYFTETIKDGIVTMTPKLKNTSFEFAFQCKAWGVEVSVIVN